MGSTRARPADESVTVCESVTTIYLHYENMYPCVAKGDRYEIVEVAVISNT